MQIAPFGAVSRAQGFTRELMMTGDAYYEFIALSDMVPLILRYQLWRGTS
jgi:hypothetical protein